MRHKTSMLFFVLSGTSKTPTTSLQLSLTAPKRSYWTFGTNLDTRGLRLNCPYVTRVPSLPAAELYGHSASLNSLAWAPHSSYHICTAGDDRQALIWDLSSIPSPIHGARDVHCCHYIHHLFIDSTTTSTHLLIPRFFTLTS